ncbi:MAG TPA: chemotaxis protein CheB [Desulfosporosinus sp.]|nr:chemotaxis protein CheB [Desulfosporosinus sp.]
MSLKRHDRNYLKPKAFNIRKFDKNYDSYQQDLTRPEFPIVGIGASAGGLGALEKFLKNVPADSGMCFVIVQHLDPTQKGYLCELLQRVTAMKVFEIKDRMLVQPNCVYVIPPNKYLAILHGMLLLLDPVTPRSLRMPIDFFFRSLSDDTQEEAIGVLLSGMGTDGTMGLRTLNEKGGVAFVQDPSYAEFDSMPNSAINEGLVDVVASAQELPTKIIDYLQHRPLITKSDQILEDKDQSGIEKIFILLRRQTGHDFSLYKHSTIYRRLERRMGIHQIKNMKIYVKFLQENPQELDLLFNELLIGVTSFFRDPLAWDQLRDEIIQMLQAKPTSHLRAWVAGCSTGEEAYSLAILFNEAKDQVPQAQYATLQIFATDMNPTAITKARNGVYPTDITADVSTGRLSRFFIKVGDGYQIFKLIREMIIFAPHNLVMDPPYYRIDILSCRNLLIYMTPVLQKKILPLFHYSLNLGGILFLGGAESIGNFTNLFKPLNSKVQIYHRSDSNKTSLPLEFPSSYASALSRIRQQVRPVENLATLADKLILQKYSPAAVVTNEKGDIVYIRGRTGKYLEPAAGKANMNIFAMAREGLRYKLTEAFNKALSERNTVSIKNVDIKSNGNIQTVDFTVQSIKEPKAMRGNVMIVFTDVATQPVGNESETRHSTNKSEYLVKIEQELMYARQEVTATRQEMQSSQEELKSANEELQSMNEELQSTNEELTTSKEEMQSINEELQAVNYELRSKVAELSRTNDDIKNLLNSTEIATVFLDNEMHIKRFTDRMSESSKLIQSDVGRPITDIASELFYPELEENARDVLRTLIPIEKEVFFHNKEKYFKVRIMPYRTMDNKINGVVLTFIDISMAKKLEIVLQESQERFNRVTENSPVTFTNQDRDLRYTWIHNPIVGLSVVLMLGKTDDELFGTKGASQMTELKKSVMLAGNSVRKAIKTSIRGQMFLHDLTVNPHRDEAGTVIGVTCALIDITDIRGLAEFDEARNEGK